MTGTRPFKPVPLIAGGGAASSELDLSATQLSAWRRDNKE